MKRRRRRFPWLLVAVASAGVLAFTFTRDRKPPPVRTLLETVSSGTFVREITGSGEIIPSRERMISFKTAGNVDRVLVAEGDRVTAGTLLATLDTTALERELAASRARLQSARADLERTRAQEQMERLEISANLANARNELASATETERVAREQLEVTEQLLAAGAASRDELRSASEALARAVRSSGQARSMIEQASARDESFAQLAEANLASARSQITTLETTIAGLEEQLRETELLAPFPGVVTSLGFQPGSAVGPSQGTIMLVDTQDLVITAGFNENRAGDLAAGQKASITPDANTSLRLPAVVSQVAETATRLNNVAQVEARLDFTAEAAGSLEAGAIRPGFSVTVRIEASRLDGVLLVPLEAISEEDGESFVFRVRPAEAGTGTASRVAVTVLDRNATFAAVTPDLLTPGDLLALMNLAALTDGQTVSFTPAGGPLP